jgi:hypothetical protein
LLAPDPLSTEGEGSVVRVFGRKDECCWSYRRTA